MKAIPSALNLPSRRSHFILLCLLSAGLAFVLGTSFWAGPIRWFGNCSQARAWNDGVVRAAGAAILVFPAALALWLSRHFVRNMLGSARGDVRFGIPLVVSMFTATDMLYWLYPGLRESAVAGWCGMPGFLRECIPDFATVALLAPVFALYTACTAHAVGWMRVKRGMRIPSTRKVFHFFIFTLAAVLQPAVGLSGVALFGVVVGMAVAYAVLRGQGFPFYEAIARQTDAPHSTFFVTVPFLSTAAGGLAANAISVHFAPIGYLITGWGDAVAEPVGSRWGRHTYSVPSLDGIRAYRSIEGSLSILVVGGMASFFWCMLVGMPWPAALKTASACALSGTFVEAVSNHGLDNFTIQATVTAVASWVGKI